MSRSIGVFLGIRFAASLFQDLVTSYCVSRLKGSLVLQALLNVELMTAWFSANVKSLLSKLKAIFHSFSRWLDRSLNSLLEWGLHFLVLSSLILRGYGFFQRVINADIGSSPSVVSASAFLQCKQLSLALSPSCLVRKLSTEPFEVSQIRKKIYIFQWVNISWRKSMDPCQWRYRCSCESKNKPIAFDKTTSFLVNQFLGVCIEAWPLFAVTSYVYERILNCLNLCPVPLATLSALDPSTHDRIIHFGCNVGWT